MAAGRISSERTWLQVFEEGVKNTLKSHLSSEAGSDAQVQPGSNADSSADKDVDNSSIQIFNYWNSLSAKGDFSRVLDRGFGEYPNSFTVLTKLLANGVPTLRRNKDGILEDLTYVDNKQRFIPESNNAKQAKKLANSLISLLEKELEGINFWKDVPPEKLKEYKKAIFSVLLFRITGAAGVSLRADYLEQEKDLIIKRDKASGKTREMYQKDLIELGSKVTAINMEPIKKIILETSEARINSPKTNSASFYQSSRSNEEPPNPDNNSPKP